jgi:hypothetical protein
LGSCPRRGQEGKSARWTKLHGQGGGQGVGKEEDEEETDEEETDKEEVEENEGNKAKWNEAELFEDEVEAVLQRAEELSTVNARTYVAFYEDQWFLAEVSRDQSQVKRGYTKLEYLVIKGTNAFSHPSKLEFHITLDEDIIIKISARAGQQQGLPGIEQKRSGKSSHPDGGLHIFQFFYFS